MPTLMPKGSSRPSMPQFKCAQCHTKFPPDSQEAKEGKHIIGEQAVGATRTGKLWSEPVFCGPILPVMPPEERAKPNPFRAARRALHANLNKRLDALSEMGRTFEQDYEAALAALQSICPHANIRPRYINPDTREVEVYLCSDCGKCPVERNPNDV